jgi:hypothetical protein
MSRIQRESGGLGAATELFLGRPSGASLEGARVVSIAIPIA